MPLPHIEKITIHVQKSAAEVMAEQRGEGEPRDLGPALIKALYDEPAYHSIVAGLVYRVYCPEGPVSPSEWQRFILTHYSDATMENVRPGMLATAAWKRGYQARWPRSRQVV